jgi:hypothetical protein
VIAHDTTCTCQLCGQVRRNAVPTTQADRDIYAAEWERWISASDGEAAKLRAGQDGAPGSPRWVALQAIARARIGASETMRLARS